MKQNNPPIMMGAPTRAAVFQQMDSLLSKKSGQLAKNIVVATPPKTMMIDKIMKKRATRLMQVKVLGL